MNKYVIDTNVLIDYPEVLKRNDIIIPYIVLQELDNLKTREGVGYNVRKLVKKMLKSDTYEVIDIRKYVSDLGEISNDDLIIQTALRLGHRLVTNDLIMQLKCKPFIDLYEPIETLLGSENYTGYVKSNSVKENIDLNSYCLVGKDIYKNENGKIKKLDDVHFRSKTLHTIIDARNTEQKMYLDMLQDKNIKVKVVTGPYGSGKDFLALTYFEKLIKEGKFDKLIWYRNNLETKDSKPIGFLPGNITEKLGPYIQQIDDLFMTPGYSNELIDLGQLELLHCGFARGRDIQDAIVYCTEAQNLTLSLILLAMGRIGRNSILFLNGDFKQTDLRDNSGLKRFIEVMRGNKLFGYVHLTKTERSEVAQLCELFDEVG